MMKKRLFAFALAALLLCTMLASCDVGNGLVDELLADFEGDLDLGVLLDDLLGDEVLGAAPEEDVLYQPDQGIGIGTEVEETWVEEWTEETWVEETEEWTTEIEWDTELPVDPIPSLQDVLVMDGDLGDWHTNNWLPYWSARFDRDNLDAWVGEVGTDDGFTMMVTCDTEYVYMAFDVNDATAQYCESGTYNNGDCFQIQLDLGGLCGKNGSYERGVFYSFGLQEDGSVHITVQCIAGDAASTVDYVMSSQDEAEGGLMGATVVREDGTGWVAEIAIPWENLIFDVLAKLGVNNLNDIEFDSDNIKVVMLVCYLDRGQDGLTSGAWGTSYKKGSLANGEGWYPENGGITLWFDPGDMRVEDFDIEDAIYNYVE